MNPGLIYASLSAYGSLDSRTGFDAIIQGESGFMQMNGTAATGPLKMPVALIDILAAHQLKEAVLVAMIKKMRTGEGSEVSTTLLGSGVASLANQATQFLVAGKIPARMGSGHPNIVPYGSTYLCADGKPIVIAAGNDKQFSALCACIGQPELSTHTDYAHNPARVKNRVALESILAAAIEQLESETLLPRLREKQVPVGAVLNMQEVFEQPAAQKQLFESDGTKGLRTVAFEGAGNEALALLPPPELGAATSRVLHRWLNMNETEIAALQQKGVIL
jgi:crotonobetainyl-CoA:carnitine CoA-transferase CaiB-like acyl-CoA transferase